MNYVSDVIKEIFMKEKKKIYIYINVMFGINLIYD